MRYTVAASGAIVVVDAKGRLITNNPCIINTSGGKNFIKTINRAKVLTTNYLKK